MPQLEEGNLWIRAVMPQDDLAGAGGQIAPRLRDVIATIPEVKGVMSQIGRPDDGTDVTGFFNIEFNVPLKPMEEWRTDRFGRPISREVIQDELAEQFQAVSRPEFQLLAVDPRQRRGGPLGREGSEFRQALRQRSADSSRSTASRC